MKVDVRLLVVLGVLLGSWLAVNAVAFWLAKRYRLGAVEIDIQRPDQLQAKLDYLRGFQGRKVVVLGDSLVYGQAMAEHGDRRWRSHTLSRRLEQKLRGEEPGTKVLVFNLGINGALPADLEALARLLVACRVDVILFDVHLRPFSADFSSEATQYARPWLKPLGGAETPAATTLLDRATGFPRRWLASWPLVRLRDPLQEALIQTSWLGGPRSKKQGEPFAASPPPGQDGEGEPVLRLTADTVLLMQIRRRLRGVHFRPDNPQRQALERLLTFLRESRQPAVVFYARENPSLVPDVIAPKRYHALRRELTEIVARHAGPLLDFDPGLEEADPLDYVDYLHLDAGGYDRLAARLLPRVRSLLDRDRLSQGKD
jgi:lysophospholipase L1-like esterase